MPVTRPRGSRGGTSPAEREAEGVRRLGRARRPLLKELEVLSTDPGYGGGEPPHLCCLRPRNMMTITPLETAAIARALRKPLFRRALPRVLARTRREIARMAGDRKREPFDCPLLEEERCLVHEHAKPIGCLGWHPPPSGSRTRASSYTGAGWEAVRRRNALNDHVYGEGWTERPIPLALAGALAPELAESPAPSRR